LRVLLVSAGYDRDERSLDGRAERLREQGHDVKVVWLKVPRSKPGQSMVSRALGVLPSYLSLLRAALARERYDLIITNTSPPFSFVPMAIRGALRGEDVTIKHWDIFPETARVAGVAAPKLLFDLADLVFKTTSRLASKHETLSEPMRKKLIELLGPDVEVEVIPLPPVEGLKPVPRSENTWLKEHGLEEKFVVMYAGNLGRMYDFEPLIEAASVLKDRDEIIFVFVGEGFHEDLIRDAAARFANVLLFPSEPEGRLSEVLCGGDLHVVSLRAGAANVMWPHKVNDLLALKLPTVAIYLDAFSCVMKCDNSIDILMYIQRLLPSHSI
jgi:glycosyltransferase involved in cell wall biosynthesis